MSTELLTSQNPSPTALAKVPALGMRKNGKQWHERKQAFRPGSGRATFKSRSVKRITIAATKAREKEMKQEKRDEQERKIKVIKDRRAAKEEKERYEKLAEKMHKKRVERLKRREKRNKLLNS